MRITLSDLITPHYCCSCGEIGAVLCSYCKYDIVSEPQNSCLVCQAPVGANGSLCSRCTQTYSKGWQVGYRSDALKKLIDDYKFERQRRAHQVLAELLDETVPQLPHDIVVVPIPTIHRHQRIRGYAHAELVAKRFAGMRGLAYRESLSRLTSHTQRGATRQQRIEQAKTAFAAKKLENERVLLIDDVFTTGATLEYAARALKTAGAKEVWVAVLSRQPLEK